MAEAGGVAIGFKATRVAILVAPDAAPGSSVAVALGDGVGVALGTSVAVTVGEGVGVGVSVRAAPAVVGANVAGTSVGVGDGVAVGGVRSAMTRNSLKPPQSLVSWPLNSS